MPRCDTTHGPVRCERERGHDGECETTQAHRLPQNAESAEQQLTRQLGNAVALYKLSVDENAKLRAALETIRTAPCDANDGASCLCCLHDRAVAADALGVRP